MLRWAIIPAAGRGTRLQPYTDQEPKVLLPVGGVTMLERTIREAQAAGITEVIVVTSPEQPKVRDYLDGLSVTGGDGAGEVRIHNVEQPRPIGIGDAFMRCRELTGDEGFGVLLPDNWFDAVVPPIGQVAADALTLESPAIGLVRVEPDEAGGLGNVGGVVLEPLGDRTHRILSLQDKQKGSFVMRGDRAVLRGCGRYACGPELYEALAATGPPAEGEWDDVPAFQWLIERRGLIGREIEGRLFDVGQIAGYEAANARLAGVNGTGA